MKDIFRVSVSLTLAFVLGFQTVNACTAPIITLRKSYKSAKSVFLGEIVSVERKHDEELPEKLQESYKVLDKITFKVIESWKGNNKNQIVIYSVPFCFCPGRQFEFLRGNKFLVFTDKNGFFDICDMNSAQMDSKYDVDVQKTIKRLDSFWFRMGANLSFLKIFKN